jgi:hypothetical protein
MPTIVSFIIYYVTLYPNFPLVFRIPHKQLLICTSTSTMLVAVTTPTPSVPTSGLFCNF